ncbi:FKBP-type peptidyl-prolyl cis-trans isomerase [Limibacter armeniacum]|uniref:FKBP-type peptidyl-prolyl cis-trans isomerase n=1 Tax=Limibacter armeniacum TaxID=466084 RepID=UPI002FE5D15C
MKNYWFKLITAATIAVGLSSCDLFSSDEINDYLAEDGDAIETFLETNNIDYRRTTNGVRIVTLNPEDSSFIEGVDGNYAGNVLDIKFRRKLFASDKAEGLLIDKEAQSMTFYLSDQRTGGFIFGLSDGITDMYMGEKAELYIPSFYAYGSNSGTINGVSVPQNAIIRMEVEVEAARDTVTQKYYEATHIAQFMKDSLDIENSSQYLLPYDDIYKVVTEAAEDSAQQVQEGDYITVDYTGKLLNGKVFDSGNEYKFFLNSSNFVKGWGISLKTMKVGETATVLMPSHYGYGMTGASSIAPYSPLIFEITVKEIIN